MFVVETAAALSAKVIFETIGATAGFAKEGIGLFDSLRERKKKDEGILSRSLKQSGNATPEAQKAVHEMYEALAEATPYVRRIVKRRILARLQAVLVSACGLAAVLGVVFTVRDVPYIGQLLSGALQWIFWPALFVLLYFGATWTLRFQELHTSAADMDEFKYLQNQPFYSLLPEVIHRKTQELAESMASQERYSLSSQERNLLLVYGHLSSIVNMLENYALTDDCANGSLAVGAYFEAAIDRAIIDVIKDMFANGNKPSYQTQTEIFDRQGLSRIVGSARYQKAIKSAIEAFEKDEDGEKAFFNELSKLGPGLFTNTLIESQRRSWMSKVPSLFSKR